MQMLFSKMAFFSLSAVARLGIADHLSGNPVPIADLAKAASVNEDFLFRVLRMLSSTGIFSEGPARHFALSPSAEFLRSDHPRSLRAMAIMFSDPWQIESYSRIDQCIRTGTDGPTLAWGHHGFEYFKTHPAEAANFHAAMSSFSSMATGAILQVANFAGFRRIADCGGGHGFFLSRILAQTPDLQGVLFDLPEVVSGAEAGGHIKAVRDRLTIESGSFFERVPEGCDAYIMKHIVHDWDDGSARRILSLMREQLASTAPETGRVFLCEMVVPDSPAPAPAKMLDIEMLVATPGGRERTAHEFAKLFESTGLRLVSITPSQSPICLLEVSL